MEKRKIFLVSFKELKNIVKNNDDMKKLIRNDELWLRDSQSSSNDVAIIASSRGWLSTCRVSVFTPASPAFTIDLSKIPYKTTGAQFNK